MKRKSIIVLLLVLLSFVFCQNALCEGLDLPEPSSQFYVLDQADILDKNAEDYIVNINEVLYKKTGTQVVVATVSSLNDIDVSLYANELFEKWEIGSGEHDNGVLMLIAPNERKLWIEIGYGLEGALPDGKVGKIKDDYMTPYFKEGMYTEGIIKSFDSIINNIEDEYNINIERENIDENFYAQPNDNHVGIFGRIKKGLLVIFILLFLFIDFKFFNGWLTFFILRNIRFGNGDNDRNKGGGGSSGGGGAGGSW